MDKDSIVLSLINGVIFRESAHRAMKSSFLLEHPKYCPRGHKHLSWSPGDDGVYCWDCNRKYPVSKCLGRCEFSEEDSNDSANHEADD